MVSRSAASRRARSAGRRRLNGPASATAPAGTRVRGSVRRGTRHRSSVPTDSRSPARSRRRRPSIGGVRVDDAHLLRPPQLPDLREVRPVVRTGSPAAASAVPRRGCDGPNGRPTASRSAGRSQQQVRAPAPGRRRPSGGRRRAGVGAARRRGRPAPPEPGVAAREQPRASLLRRTAATRTPASRGRVVRRSPCHRAGVSPCTHTERRSPRRGCRRRPPPPAVAIRTPRGHLVGVVQHGVGLAPRHQGAVGV